MKSAGAVTIVRVLGFRRIPKNDSVVLTISGSSQDTELQQFKTFKSATDPDATELNGLSGFIKFTLQQLQKSSFVLKLIQTMTGSTTAFTLSFDSSSANYITKVFSENPQDAKTKQFMCIQISKIQQMQVAFY